MTSTRAGADIDLANTTLRHVPELREFLKRHRAYLSKADREIIEVACAVMEEGGARLMLRNGVGMRQEEMDLGRETARQSALASDPQRAMEQAR